MVHPGICALEHVVEADVSPGPIIGKAARDDDVLGADVLYGAVVELLHEFLAGAVVAPRENGYELVATDPVHRAV